MVQMNCNLDLQVNMTSSKMDLELCNKFEDKPNFAGLDVICVGLPGTGETSLKYALSWLLQGACYDITK